MTRLLPLLCILFANEVKSSGQPLTDYSSLINTLRSAGVVVKPGDEIVQPFFSVRGRVINVAGEDVQVFEYVRLEEADAQAAVVSPNGTTVGSTTVYWDASPHFYKKEKLVVLYVGDNTKLLKVLADALGPQFAGQK